MDILSHLFDKLHYFNSIQFMPHGHCYHWLPSLILLHVFSDAIIGLSYMIIPFGLAYLIKQRKDVPFGWMFFCFSAFIFSCGATHFVQIWTLWYADYWLSGFVKLFTAIISFITALLLIRLLPLAIKLPSPEMLNEANLALAYEIQQRKEKETVIAQVQKEITQKNKTLEKANRLKSEFLANMSHELRTPLNAIIGFSELMFNGKVGAVSKEHKEYLGDILSSSRHLLRLINDVLDLSKIEAGKMEFFPEAVNPAQLVNEIKDILRSGIAEKYIHFTLHCDLDISEVKIDAAKFKQVLYNYISNALKFTPNKGTINVNICTDKPGFFRLEVIDNGIGIKEEDMPKLFIEFQQLDSGTSKKYPGTGLGLSLTKYIIEAQGGFVGCRSRFGKGSTFYAVLPSSPIHSTQSRPSQYSSVGLGPRILVIEDNLQDQNMIVEYLNNAGYSVEVASNGKQALDLAKKIHFDAITLDLLLPDTNGWELIKELRADDMNADIPVIVITVVNAKLSSFGGFLINDFLEKPLNQNELISSLKRANVAPDSKKSILIIDDNIHDLNLVKTTFSSLGYKTICSSNPKNVLENIHKIQPLVLILDLLMPEMNGFEFLHEFRNKPEGQSTPVIIWTAKDMTTHDHMQLKKYAQGYAAKGDGAVSALLTELKNFLPAKK